MEAKHRGSRTYIKHTQLRVNLYLETHTNPQMFLKSKQSSSLQSLSEWNMLVQSEVKKSSWLAHYDVDSRRAS